MRKSYTYLPPNLPPRLLSRDAAAAYVGIGTTKFDEMVGDSRMPRPRRVDGRKLWDLRQIDSAIDNLPLDHVEEANPWD